MNRFYTWITQRIAIGDYESSYNEFDVIVNINYPYNGVEKDIIHKKTQDNKIIFLVGLHDDANEPMEECLKYLIPKLFNDYYDKKILFHCYAGISRSTTCALALLYHHSKSSLLNCYCFVKAKRPRIEPNLGFVRALTNFTKDDSLEKFIFRQNNFNDFLKKSYKKN